MTDSAHPPESIIFGNRLPVGLSKGTSVLGYLKIGLPHQGALGSFNFSRSGLLRRQLMDLKNSGMLLLSCSGVIPKN